MTCIIANRATGVMAADDRGTTDGGFMYPVKIKKIDRTEHAVWGLCGCPGVIRRNYPQKWSPLVRDQLSDLIAEYSTQENECAALLIDHTGLYMIDGTGYVMAASEDILSIGSGSEAAMAYAKGYYTAVFDTGTARGMLATPQMTAGWDTDVLVNAVKCAAGMHASVSDNVQVERFRTK